MFKFVATLADVLNEAPVVVKNVVFDVISAALALREAKETNKANTYFILKTQIGYEITILR